VELTVHDGRWPPASAPRPSCRRSGLRTARSSCPGLRGAASPRRRTRSARLYEQLQFGDVAGDVGQDQESDQEQEFAISPEWRVWLEEFRRRVGELARETPTTDAKMRRRSPAPTGLSVAPLSAWLWCRTALTVCGIGHKAGWSASERRPRAVTHIVRVFGCIPR
jgi:hypothetical protein